MNRKMEVRNFGLGSRDVAIAMNNAYKLTEHSFASIAAAKSAFRDFKAHLKSDGVTDLRKVNREHVLSYADSLNARFEANEISASTAQNYLSKVNVALESARLDRALRVNGVKDAGLPTRTGVATSNKSASLASHEQAKTLVNERLALQLDLQRNLGLRFKESCLIDAKKALADALKTGRVAITDGTKGGRERTLDVTSKPQIEALQAAATMQANDRSLIPSYQSFAEYKFQAYREISKFCGI